jgi:hypothetical protein
VPVIAPSTLHDVPAEHGYADRFTVFGHEVCFGDEIIATSPNVSRCSTLSPGARSLRLAFSTLARYLGAHVMCS